MKLKHILLGLLSLLFLSSCGISSDDIRLEEWQKVEVKGTTLSQSRLNLNACIANDSKMKVALKEANLRVHTKDGKDILEAIVDEQITLPKRCTTDVSVPVTIRYKGGLGAISSISRLTLNSSDLRVSGTVRVKGGCIKKKFELKDMPFDKAMKKLGLDPEDLKTF